MTAAEKAVWEVIRLRPCGLKFRRQHVVGPFIVDFYCHEALFVLEIDGAVHDAQQAEDAARDAWMRSQGVTVARLRNEVVLADEEGLFLVLEKVIRTAMEDQKR